MKFHESPIDQRLREALPNYYIAGVVKDPSLSQALPMITVGRTGNTDIAIRELHMSKNHCYFEVYESGEMVIVDTNSTNGTWIKGMKLEEGRPYPVDDGTKIKFGGKFRPFYCSRGPFGIVSVFLLGIVPRIGGSNLLSTLTTLTPTA